MEAIQKHVPCRRKLGQDQLDRVGGTLPRLPEGGVAEPFGERFSGALGGGFDLLQLLESQPGGNGFGAESRSRFIACRRGRVRRGRDAGSAHGGSEPRKHPAFGALHPSSAGFDRKYITTAESMCLQDGRFSVYECKRANPHEFAKRVKLLIRNRLP